MLPERKIPAWRLPPLPGEREDETRERRNRAYFTEQLESNAEWFRRMGASLDFAGRRVLELGCGHGALSVLAAGHGAAQVTGIDLDEERIAFARRNLATNYPGLAPRIRFAAADIATLEGRFDLVISKDTFEHIADLDAVMLHIRRLLAPGGTLAIGFGPLFYSPFGDHGRFRLRLPWLHAFLPERLIGVSSRELGLNRLTPHGFRELMARFQWHDLHIAYNRGGKKLFTLFNLLRRVPGLERYFTANIYALATVE